MKWESFLGIPQKMLAASLRTKEKMQLVAVCGKSIQILNEPLHSAKGGTDAESPTQSAGKTEWKLQGYA